MAKQSKSEDAGKSSKKKKKDKETSEEWEEVYHHSDNEGSIHHCSLNDEDTPDGLFFSPKKVKKKPKRSKSTTSVSSDGGLKEIKKKKKKKDGDGDDAYDDDASTRSGRSIKSTKSLKDRKKRIKKPKSETGDEESITSHASSKSKRGKRTSSKSLSEFLEPQLQSPGPYASKDNMTRDMEDDDILDLKHDNEALVAETITLRKQLSEVLAAGPTEMVELRRDLKRYKNVVTELQTEVQEYEDAVAEKDNLIKKLTHAVDSQLDKVEYLELKLQRAEEEFCKMEDELKDMEDEIDLLKNGKSGRRGRRFEDSDNDSSDDEAGREASLNEKEKLLSRRESELEHREADLLDRERSINDHETNLRGQAAIDVGDELDNLRVKELRMKERERELLELEERLNIREAALEEREHDITQKQQDTPHHRDKRAYENGDEVSNTASSQIAKLESEIQDLHQQLSETVNGNDDSSDIISELKQHLQESQVELAEIKQENSSLRETEKNMVAQAKDREAEHDIQIQTIQEGNNKQIQELYEENRSLQTEVAVLQEQNQNLKKSIPEEGVDPMDHAMAGLQEEIAGLREKIVEKEKEVKTRNEEVNRLLQKIEERGVEIVEIRSEYASIEEQLKETKATTTKKMSQKDETIAFMQNEMVRIMKEKSSIEQKVQSQANTSRPAHSVTPVVHTTQLDQEKTEAAERAKIQAFNDQITELDKANKRLEEDLKLAQYKHGLKLKEKEARILQVEEEVADLSWQLKIRKEADYVSLLQDRKERKRELDETKAKLKKSKEHTADLDREIETLKQHQKDLENDIEELNKSLVSRDSGDYVSGLKRQIRSLKEHNTALERKLEIESQNTREVIAKKDAKLFALKKEIRDLKYPGKAVVRGMLAFATGGTDDEQSLASESSHSLKRSSHQPHHSVESRSKPAEASERSERTRATIWSAITSPFGQKKPDSSRMLNEKGAGFHPLPEGSLLAEDESQAAQALSASSTIPEVDEIEKKEHKDESGKEIVNDATTLEDESSPSKEGEGLQAGDENKDEALLVSDDEEVDHTKNNETEGVDRTADKVFI